LQPSGRFALHPSPRASTTSSACSDGPPSGGIPPWYSEDVLQPVVPPPIEPSGVRDPRRRHEVAVADDLSNGNRRLRRAGHPNLGEDPRSAIRLPADDDEDDVRAVDPAPRLVPPKPLRSGFLHRPVLNVEARRPPQLLAEELGDDPVVVEVEADEHPGPWGPDQARLVRRGCKRRGLDPDAARSLGSELIRPCRHSSLMLPRRSDGMPTVTPICHSRNASAGSPPTAPLRPPTSS
jgi:hypothetical protein